MPHPVDDSRCRLLWAKTDLEALKAELAPYLASRPYEFPTEHVGGVLKALPPIVTVEPPEGVRRKVSGCIENLRPILDYIAWQLGTKSPTRPLSKTEEKRITFPIITDPAKFQESDTVKLLKGVCGVPAAAIDDIERVQPYHADYKPLETLSLLANPAKHRYCVVTTANTETATVELSVEGAPIPHCEMQHPDSKIVVMGSNVTGMIVRKLTVADLLNPFKGQEDIARLKQTNDQSLWVSGQAGTAKVDGQVTLFVSIENASEKPEPVETTLERIINCVAGVIQIYEGHF